MLVVIILKSRLLWVMSEQNRGDLRYLVYERYGFVGNDSGCDPLLVNL